MEGVHECGWSRVCVCVCKQCWNSGILTRLWWIYLICSFKFEMRLSQTEKVTSGMFGGFLLLNMQKQNVSWRQRTCAHTSSHTNIRLSPSPTADPQNLFPSPRENSRERRECSFFFIGKTICPNLQRDASHHPLYSFSRAHHPLTRTHAHIQTSGYLDRDTLLSVSLSFWG